MRREQTVGPESSGALRESPVEDQQHCRCLVRRRLREQEVASKLSSQRSWPPGGTIAHAPRRVANFELTQRSSFTSPKQIPTACEHQLQGCVLHSGTPHTHRPSPLVQSILAVPLACACQPRDACMLPRGHLPVAMPQLSLEHTPCISVAPSGMTARHSQPVGGASTSIRRAARISRGDADARRRRPPRLCCRG